MSEQKLEIFNVLNFLNNGYELEDILKEGQFGTFNLLKIALTIWSMKDILRGMYQSQPMWK